MKMDHARRVLLMTAVLAGPVGFAAVPRPWTPVEAKDDAVSVVGRTYAFDKLALSASVYRRDGKVLAVVSNLGGDAAKTTVAVPAGLSKVVDARTGESLVVSDGKVAFPVGPFTGRLLRME